MSDAGFPFAAVVGQDDAKLALQLLAVDPRIGGVLLRGEKGSAKTTLARGLADLLDGDARFVDLPLGATEDRLIGSIDIGRALTANEVAFTPGLLADADGGVLYVDEINLLPDHLVDTLLDVSVSGINRVERDGLSHQHDARFVLIGSMNPEEGELRPQLLDRFGLSVEVVASHDVDERAEAVRRRLSFDGALAPGADVSQETERLRDSLASARLASIDDALIADASRLALAVGAEGLRADLVLCRAAAAHAGLDGRNETTAEDLRRVAPLVLAHRARRNPFDPPVLPPQAIEDALDQLQDESDPQESKASADSGTDAAPDPPALDESDGEGSTAPMDAGDSRTPPTGSSARSARGRSDSTPGRHSMTTSTSGRTVRDVGAEAGVNRPLAVAATVRQVAGRRSNDPEASVESGDLRFAVRERPAGHLLILVVDTSGSMGAEGRAQLATGTALGLLSDAYQRRDQVAMVTVGGAGAKVVLSPTGSIEVARNRLSDLEVGGASPLADGLREARAVADRRRDVSRQPFVVLISDGRATGAGDAQQQTLDAAMELRRAEIGGLVLDCESAIPRLGLCEALAEAMGVPRVDADRLGAGDAATAIRSMTEESHRAR